MGFMDFETDLQEFDDGTVLDIDSDEETLPFRYSITAYGADFPVDGLVDRLKSRDIIIPRFGEITQELSSDVRPFQRQRVWSRPQKDRFIESLLLGLPVPEIFLVAEKDGRYLVLDGQQRLLALSDFFSGMTDQREFRLRHVQEDLKSTYEELSDEDRRRLNNALIHATIVRQDVPSEGQSSIYTLFERINTGGTQLQPQEIRAALFHGPYVDLIANLNQDESWRQLYGKPSIRLKDQELILRFFALMHDNVGGSPTYRRPMKGFLSEHLGHNRDLNIFDGESLTSMFTTATESVLSTIGPDAFKPHSRQNNSAVLDSILVGISRRLEKGPIADSTMILGAYQDLVELAEYRFATEQATSDEANVRARLDLATSFFAEVD